MIFRNGTPAGNTSSSNTKLGLARTRRRRDHDNDATLSSDQEAPALSDLEPIAFPGRPAQRPSASAPKDTTFDRRELLRILDLYGRMVAAGEWRDYAIAFMKDRAVFSIFRRSSEQPLYRIEKNPALARRQGEYAVVNSTGFVLKRGHDLGRVLAVIDKRLSVVN
ncbi:MAG: DUF2794 domain-containing protein [Rhizobiales bacterium]|nr:DUF2794 domain-containing protein [Hyphomicrobiales bacterium]